MNKRISVGQRIVDACVKMNVVSAVEGEELLKIIQEKDQSSIDDFLLDEHIVDHETLLKILQRIYGIQSYDVRGHFFNHELVLVFPQDFLTNNALIPLDVDVEGDILTVVVSDPEDEEIIDQVSNYVPYTVNIVVGIRRDICDAIEEYYDKDVINGDIDDEENREDDDLADSDIVDLD